MQTDSLYQPIIHPTLESYRRLKLIYTRDSLLKSITYLSGIKQQVLADWDKHPSCDPETPIREQISRALQCISQRPQLAVYLKRNEPQTPTRQSAKPAQEKRRYTRRRPEKSPEHIQLEQQMNSLGILNVGR